MKHWGKRIAAALLAVGMLLSVSGCNNGSSLIQFEPPKKGQTVAEMIVKDYGTIKIMLFEEQAPKAVENFVTHAKNGYYDGLTFHRVMADFMIQGGDPTGTGREGESIWGEPFEDEFSDQLRNFTGALSMANSGPNTNGSQFFIMCSPKMSGGQQEFDYYNTVSRVQQGHESLEYPKEQMEKYIEVGGAPWLDDVHTVFGQVYEGLDIVEKIMQQETDESAKPLTDVVIETIKISEYQG